MTKKNDKKLRLIEAAQQLFKERGFNSTTLAIIAERANVPLGNVYYYFESKDSILTAVLDNFYMQMQQKLNQYNDLQWQKERLRAFIQSISDNAPELSCYGDPLMSLARDTMGSDSHITDLFNNIIKYQTRWVSQQFIGLNSDPNTAAQLFLQRIYGVISISMMLKEEQYLKDHCERLLTELGV